MSEEEIFVKQSSQRGFLSMAFAVGLGVMGAAFLVLGLALMANLTAADIGVGLVVALCGANIGFLASWLWRDERSKSGWRIVIGPGTLDLDLPPGRSLVHRAPPVHRRVRCDEINAIETRLEAYMSLGVTGMMRACSLRLDDGEIVFLGEDRGLNTGYATTKVEEAAEGIARACGVEVHDLGMVEGRGGLLLLTFTATPSWGAPPVDAVRREELWAAAGATGVLARYAAFAPLFGPPK